MIAGKIKQSLWFGFNRQNARQHTTSLRLLWHIRHFAVTLPVTLPVFYRNSTNFNSHLNTRDTDREPTSAEPG